VTGPQTALLFVAAVLGGVLNAVAGGGSFISFPALLFVGVPPIAANATNAVALWPAGIASTFAYRKDIRTPRPVILALGLASFVGGMLGAVLLLLTSDTTFIYLLPWLLLVASALFTFGGLLTKRLRGARDQGEGRLVLLAGALPQLVISIYGGYFGGGMGIMMMAVWSVMGMTNIHEMNGLKGILGTIINGTAVVAFILAKAVAWAPGIVMVIGATLGAYSGASLARRLDPRWVRWFVGIVAWVMTAIFFVKAYVRF
jgi:uncharacterized membrane protein YfcA